MHAESKIAALNEQRFAKGQRTTDFYLALHSGDLLFGNFGSTNRLDFTVLGPAVNEASRIGGMCRSLDQRIIVSSAFAEGAGPRRRDLVSLGRYALRGVGQPQELFTIDRSTIRRS
jgi:adenylate cyclase